MSEEIAIVPEFGGVFSVLSLEDGSYLWEDNLALLSPKTAIEKMSSIKAEPSISDKTFFVIAQNGRLALYDLINNKMIWEQEDKWYQIIWIAVVLFCYF